MIDWDVIERKENGFLGEVLQLITYKWFARTFTWADLIADLVGGILALVFITLAKKKMKL